MTRTALEGFGKTLLASDGKFQPREEYSPVPRQSPPCSGRSRQSLAVAANAASLDRPARGGCEIDGRDGRMARSAAEQKNGL